MWAQLIKFNVLPTDEQELTDLVEQLHATEQADSGLLRTLVMRDQSDPSKMYTLVLFESEEKARAREQDPRRDAGLQTVQAMMERLLDGPPEFTDLTVFRDM